MNAVSWSQQKPSLANFVESVEGKWGAVGMQRAAAEGRAGGHFGTGRGSSGRGSILQMCVEYRTSAFYKKTKFLLVLSLIGYKSSFQISFSPFFLPLIAASI